MRKALARLVIGLIAASKQLGGGSTRFLLALIIGLVGNSAAFAKTLDADDVTISMCRTVSVAASQFMDMRQHGATFSEISDGVEFEPALRIVKRVFSVPVEETNPRKFKASVEFGVNIAFECLEYPSRFSE